MANKANKVKVSQYDGTFVRVGDSFQRFDKGSEIPDYADSDHVALLEERGMVADGEPHSGLTHVTVGPAPFDVDEDAAKSRRSSASKDA